LKRILLTAATLALTTSAAWAHPGHAIEGTFAYGFLHPIGGLDHVLAMVTVGLLAFTLGGQALWLLPCTFIAAMLGGAMLGLAGIALPLVEPMIACSVIVLGAMVAAGLRLPTPVAVALVAAFAVFHGYAHGAEAPTGSGSLLAYAAGFVLATALLQLAGIAIGALLSRLHSRLAPASLRTGAAVISLAGVGLLAGLI